MTPPASRRIAPAVLPRLRHLFQRHCLIALAIVLVALSARMIVPVGYMPTIADGGVVVTLCTGQGAIDVAVADAAPALRDLAQHGGHHEGDGQAKAGPCAFAGVSAASLAAADPVLLALAILFIVTTLFRLPQGRALTAPAFLWPPRTGPPAAA